MDLTDVRADLMASGLSSGDLTDDPLEVFGHWFEHARDVGVDQPEAMVLSTVGIGASGPVPSSRFVLLRGVDERGFVFFTNRESRKAREIAAVGSCSLLFPWAVIGRQVRVEGTAAPLGADEDDAYFAGRPRGSQVSAWASPQSRVVPDRAFLEERVAQVDAEHEGEDVPRPPHWGGYVVRPEAVELWQQRESRLHDRFRYERDGDTWSVVRLAP